MTAEDFKNRFRDLTGYEPFPWQEELFTRFCQGTNAIPDRCDIPTGLGNTSVIAVWLLARKLKPETSLPRRLVYVVNRRTVVDQTTDEVEKIRRNLPKIGRDANSLAISTLRGQFADNREWSADPSKEAVICGTVDMIGSRLLFSGYGVGFKGKPLHAGFLGQDSLIVHDEAHLEPAFQDLLVALDKEQSRGRFPDRYPLRVMELSATSRRTHAGDADSVLRLTENDHANLTVNERINAKKQLHLVPQSDSKIGAQIGKIAVNQFASSNDAILVFVRTIEDVKSVADALSKAKLPFAQLIGPMRGLERDRLTNPRDKDGSPIFARFLQPPKADAPESEQWRVTPAEGTIFLICTSAGEVGVNISADHMICDLSTFESMAQRFGRVNRFGTRSDTQIHIVYPAKFDDKPLDQARLKTLELLRQLGTDVSPNALSKLPESERVSAFAPSPVILPTSDMLFDAWSLTSIRDKMPGRPLVEPYLHGIRDYEPPETQIAWREEVGVIVGKELLDEHSPEDLLDEYPVKPHELVGDQSDRVWKKLETLAEKYPDKPVWIVDKEGSVEVIHRIADLETDRKRGIEKIENRIILLPHDVGGLTPAGMLDASYPPAPGNNDVADALTDNSGRAIRLRIWKDDADFDEKSARLRHILCIDIPDKDDEEDAKRSWHWFELPIAKDNSKNAIHPVLLSVHVQDVVDKMRDILSRLTLHVDPATDQALKDALLLAAEFHDLGKRREQWQRSIGRPLKYNNEPVQWFGKSGRKWKPRKIADYRHEFGSLVDLQAEPRFQALNDDAKNLVQHLIATHHGQGRPHFTAVQCIDPIHRLVDCAPLAMEVPRRFARLQRKFGRWGLAYIESLLRAADWHASANPSKFFEEDKK